jgi:type IV secretory pathway component VirB8
MKKLLAATLLIAFVSPVLAADEFYVVQDAKTKKCTIVDKKPTTTTETTVVGNSVYKTRTEAETGMKSVKVCTSN